MVAVSELVAGHYRVVRPVAEGGMSRVWLAADAADGRQVAVKQCAPPDGLTAEEQDLVRSWTLREARAFARVDHPNVIRILEVVPDPAGPWIVMEYVPSRSLLQVVRESGPLPPARVAAIGLAVLDGLNAAGRAGVLHLDVKPGNVLVADDGRIVLNDFGPAVTEQGIGALAGAGIIVGSPRYVAPERLFDGVSTAQADLWSLGATLYYAVEGRPPYLRATPAATLRALADTTPDPPHRAGPLTAVLEGLLQRVPDARITAAETEAELRAIIGEPARPAEPPRPAVPEVPSRGRALRRRAVLVVGAVAVAAALANAAAGAGPAAEGRPTGTSGPRGRAAAPSRAPFTLPAGFRWWNDPSGYRVAVPAGWRRSPDGTGAVRFAAARGGPVLRVGEWTPAPVSVLSGLIGEERDLRLTGYRRIRIEPAAEPPGAVWEYTYREPGGGVMRVEERVLVDGGRTYRVRWQAPRDTWAAGLATLDVVVASVGPLPGA